MVSDDKAKKVKGRDFTFIVYPDSAPENWRTILDETFLRWVESPLHDRDVNADGEIKKAHWHILISFDGPVTLEHVQKIIAPLNSPIPMKVGSAKGLVRYMIHMDNPEKVQYSRDEIVGHNGADVSAYFEMTATNKLLLMKEIITFIREHEITNFMDLLMICIETSDDWFDIAVNYNTLAINKALDAMWQIKKSENNIENDR